MLLTQIYRTVRGALEAQHRKNSKTRKLKYELVRCLDNGKVDRDAYTPGRLYAWRLQSAWRQGGVFVYPVPKKSVLEAEVYPLKIAYAKRTDPILREPSRDPEWMLERREKWDRRKARLDRYLLQEKLKELK